MMKNDKNLFGKVIFFLVIMFIFGMMIGRWTGSSNTDEINAFLQENELNTQSYIIEQELFENFENGDCEIANARMTGLGNELWKIGNKLSPEDSEDKLGEDNFRFLKVKYHLMQIRLYTMFYNLDKDCNSTSSVILFYYGDDDDSRVQGEILDRIVEDNEVNVFAIEHEYAEELDFAQKHYNITKTPSLILNYDIKREGLSSYEEILSSLG